MFKLELADGLARRIASYATNTATPFKLEAVGGLEPAMELSNGADTPTGSHVRELLKELRGRFEDTGELKRAILELASSGPGFFTYHTRVSPETVSSSMFQELKLPAAGEAARRTERRRDTFVAIALEHALEALAAAEQIGPLYPYWVQWLCTGMASSGVAVVFFGGSWWDGATSLCLGCIVGLLGSFTHTADGEQRFLRAYEFVSATLVALLAKAISALVRPICYEVVSISSLIWLLQARPEPPPAASGRPPSAAKPALPAAGIPHDQRGCGAGNAQPHQRHSSALHWRALCAPRCGRVSRSKQAPELRPLAPRHCDHSHDRIRAGRRIHACLHPGP